MLASAPVEWGEGDRFSETEGRNHRLRRRIPALAGFAENPRAEVVAIAGLDEERCRDLAKQFDVPRVYRDYQDLIADPDIEAVTVAVPNILHVPVALAALEAGKHVMVEKPLAPTAAEGQRIIEAARRADRVLGVVFNRRGRQDVQLVKKEVERGNLARSTTPAHSGCGARAFPVWAPGSPRSRWRAEAH